MKHSLIIIIFTILFAGCTINMAPSQEQVEKKVPAQIEMKQAEQSKHAPWPQDGKEYWYARYFHTMASHPGIQRRIKPEDVFAIVKCTMNKYEEDHSWEWFRKNLADVQILTQENTQYVYVVTRACADAQKAKTLKPLGVGNTI
jgi:PBP1b-binding outer membrane lipoprotein LpoB